MSQNVTDLQVAVLNKVYTHTSVLCSCWTWKKGNKTDCTNQQGIKLQEASNTEVSLNEQGRSHQEMCIKPVSLCTSRVQLRHPCVKMSNNKTFFVGDTHIYMYIYTWYYYGDTVYYLWHNQKDEPVSASSLKSPGGAINILNILPIFMTKHSREKKQHPGFSKCLTNLHSLCEANIFSHEDSIIWWFSHVP